MHKHHAVSMNHQAKNNRPVHSKFFRVQELRESRGGRPGLSVLMSLTVSVDLKQQ